MVIPRLAILGSVTEVCEAQVDHGCGRVDEAHPIAAGFVTAERDPGAIFQAREHVLDTMAPGVDRLVPWRWIEHALLGRGMNGATLRGKVGMQLGGNLAAVERCVGGWQISHQRPGVAQVEVLRWAADQPQDTAMTIGAGD